jgi:glycosyltransferase involved in cell wall biosynthesis
MPSTGPRVVSVCVSGFIGTNEAQRSIARGSSRVRHFVLTEPKVNGPETQFLLAHFRQTKPRTIIVGGWSAHYEPLLALTRRGIDIGVYWTSSGAQTEIGSEIARFGAVLADRRIRYLLCLDPALAQSPLRQAKTVIYLPSRIPPAEPVARPRQSERPTVLSLFCSPHEYPRKNVLNTLLAVAALTRPCVLYLNGLSHDAVYADLLKRLGIACEDFGWMDRDAYERVLQRVDLGLQASFVESFGQVAVDHLVRGVPVVAAAQLPALRSAPRSIAGTLLVANPDDWRDIHATIERWLDDPGRSRRASAVLLRQLRADDARRRRIINDVLRRLS